MTLDIKIPSFKFQFVRLDAKLKEMGVVVDLENLRKNIRFYQVENEVVEIEGENEYEYLRSLNRLISDNGFYWMRLEHDGYTEYQPGYLYLSEYYLESHGRPRAHITHCDKLVQIGRERYTWSSSQSVSITDRDKVWSYKRNRMFGYEDEDEEFRPVKVQLDYLPICKICKREILSRHETTKELLNDQSYFRIYEEKHTYLVSDGYSFNWTFLSRKFRESKNFTCEKCGFSPDPKVPEEKACVHVHHRNGNKLDNRINNLECLCAVCHAEVDANHAAKIKETNEYKYLARKRRIIYKSNIRFRSEEDL